MLRNPAPIMGLTLGLSLSLPMAALATPQGWSPLLDPQELATILEAEDDIRIVHVSGEFAAGHIPGAGFSAYADWRGGPANPGALLDPDTYAFEAARLGIETDTPVVIVHAGANPSDMGTAARVYWTLKSLGVQDLALLNGGFAAWAEAELPVSTTPAYIEMSDFAGEWQDDWYISTAEVAELVDRGEARLIDSRPRGFFEGIAWSIARPGTVRGADNVEFEDFFEGNRMVSPERAREIAVANGLDNAPVTVSFCNTGHWAALNWFALSELAGIENTRLYAESMAEYAQAGHALDNEPGRVAFLWRSTVRWVEGMF